MAKNVLAYQMVSSHDTHDFNVKISKLLTEGWQPYKKPDTVVQGVSMYHSQAMVKYQE
jgi:hypothetical protein